MVGDQRAARTARDFCGNGNGNGGGGLRRVTIPGVPDIETPFDDLTTRRWYGTSRPSRGPRPTPLAASVEAIRRAIFDEAQDTRATDGPAREAVPGAGDLLHRGVAALFFASAAGASRWWR